jgi:hypothetical protein
MKKLIVVFLLIIAGHVMAQDANDAIRLGMPGLGFSARALGMGNAYIGLSDDNAASYFNPAGFGLMRKLEFSGALDYSNMGNNASLFNSTTTNSSSATRLSNLSFTFPFPTTRGSLVFGLSYHNTKDFTGTLKFDGFNPNNSYIDYLAGGSSANIPYDLWLTDTLDNTILKNRLNQSGSILYSGSINNWTLSGAVEVYKNLFLGLNLNIISGSYESNNDWYEDDLNNLYQGITVAGNNNTTDFQTFYLNRLLKWDLSGWDAKFGMMYQIQSVARLGLTVQFPKSFTVKETFDVSGYSQFANTTYNLNPDNYSDAVSYDITTPFEIGIGAAFNLRGLILSAQGTFIDYTQLKFENPENFSNGETYFAGVNKDITNTLRPVLNYNLGAEYTIPMIGLRLRGGFMVQPSAYKDDPSERDRKFVTAGIGYLAEDAIGIDLGFAHGWWKDIGDNYGINLSRTSQDITYNKFILSATYRF